MKYNLTYIVFILCWTCNCTHQSPKVNPKCDSEDRQKITAMFGNFEKLPKWWIDCQNSCNICDCKGIECDIQTGTYITSIDMRSAGLKGSFPNDGTISWPKYLSKLYLNNNRINGTFSFLQLPDTISTIDISQNEIVGPIEFSGFANFKNSNDVVFIGDESVYCDSDIYCQNERQEMQDKIDNNDYMLICDGKDRTQMKCIGKTDCESTCQCDCKSVLSSIAKQREEFWWHVAIPVMAFASVAVVIQVAYCAWDGCMITE